MNLLVAAFVHNSHQNLENLKSQFLRRLWERHDTNLNTNNLKNIAKYCNLLKNIVIIVTWFCLQQPHTSKFLRVLNFKFPIYWNGYLCRHNDCTQLTTRYNIIIKQHVFVCNFVVYRCGEKHLKQNNLEMKIKLCLLGMCFALSIHMKLLRGRAARQDIMAKHCLRHLPAWQKEKYWFRAGYFL